jgi:hypothetical protein
MQMKIDKFVGATIGVHAVADQHQSLPLLL